MSLPPELDFTRDPEASPERMDRAMAYIFQRLGQLLALKPSIEAEIVALRDIGVERLNAGLEPAFTRANQILAALEPIFQLYVQGQPLAALRAELLDLIEADALALEQDRLAPIDAAVAAHSTALAALADEAWFNNRG